MATALSNAFATYRNSRGLARLEAENLDAARLNVEVALERFRLGMITSIELREVQTTRTDIESRILGARFFEAKRAETTLLQLSGHLLERLR